MKDYKLKEALTNLTQTVKSLKEKVTEMGEKYEILVETLDELLNEPITDKGISSLTDDDIAKIRLSRIKDGVPKSVLSARYGVSIDVISEIVSTTRWESINRVETNE